MANWEGQRNPKAKLTPEIVEELRKTLVIKPGRKRLTRGAGIVASAAKKYGVTKESIWNAISGRNWAAEQRKDEHNGR